MCSSPVQQRGASSRSVSAGPSPRSTRKRKSRPGYKSPAKLARSKEKAKHFKLVLRFKQESFNLTAEIGNLKTYIRLCDKSHQDEIASIENDSTNKQNLIIRKYNQLSKMYSNLQDNFLKSERNKKHLQERLDVTLEENKSLVRKISTFQQFHPVSSSLHSPLDLRLRALEEQILPVNTVQNSPLDLCLESKPPEFVYDLVNF